MRGKRTRLGFTLIELLITVVVLSILAMAAVPMMDVAEKRKVRAAAEEVYSAAQYARSEALKQSVDVFFVARTNAAGTNWCVGVGITDCNCLTGACELRNTAFNVANSRTEIVNAAGAAITAATPVAVTFNYVRGTANPNTVGVRHISKPVANIATGDRYRLDVVINRMGRVRVSAPDGENRVYFPEYE